MDDNPYRPPQTENGMTIGNQDVAKNVGLGILGFLSAGVFAAPLVFLTLIIAASINLPDYSEIFVSFQSPVVCGPLSGLGVWYFTRKSKRPFAIGALVFAIASFLLSGGCGIFLLSLG